MADVTCVSMKRLERIILKIADYCIMNATHLFLDIDIKVNSNYHDWGPPRLLL